MPLATHHPTPTALAIGGSDSGAGAGIQADLKTFTALGVHGTTAITCVTAQNPDRVSAVQMCLPKIVGQQIDAVWEGFAPAAVKTGMLFHREIVREVARRLKTKTDLRLVIDPVITATSGRVLLKPSALKALREQLLPLATLITPNVAEAEVLAECRITTPATMRRAAAVLYARYHTAVLVKGGHLPQHGVAADVFFDRAGELILSAPWRRGLRTHGTGCTLAAAITAHLARGKPLRTAVTLGKAYLTQAIARGHRVRGYYVLNHCF